MSSQVAVIERKWFVIAPDGGECDVALQIGAPSQERDGEWCVVVRLVGWDLGSHKIFGVDSWQAVALGMKFAASRAQDFCGRGWLLYWERGGEVVTQQEIDLW